MRRVTIAEAHRMAAAYEGGKSMKEVGAEFGWHSTVVKYHILSLGVHLRSRSQWTTGWRKHTVVGGRKNCTTCTRWRYLNDFGRDPKLPDGVAHRCSSCRRSIAKARRADPVLGEMAREYDRIWHEGKRRAAGIPQQKMRPRRDDDGRVLLPIEPIVEAIEEWLAAQPDEGAVSLLADRSGVTERRIWAYRNGGNDADSIELHNADRLAMAIGSHLDLIYEQTS